MPKVGVIKGVLAKDIEVVGEKVVNLRTCARPYRNTYSVAQLRALKRVVEEYGSGKVHLSPRHNLEIPEVRQQDVDKALKVLYISGLFPGGAGTSVRNVFTCPTGCTRSLRPVQELGTMLSTNFGDKDMPNKFTVSLAGCSNGCSRPHHTDVGVIAVGKVVATGKKCPAGCSACLSSCRFDALQRADESIRLTEKCTRCGFCAAACPHGVLEVEATGFRVLIGGKEGSTVRFGQEVAAFATDFEVLEILDRVLSTYKQLAQLRQGSVRKKERLAEVIDRVGLDPFTLPEQS